MDKQRLTTLINQPEKLKETDFRDLTKLKNEFPYFQAISPLITIGSKKYSPQSEKKHLQSAAIYALDRKHLKELITVDYDSPAAETSKEKFQQKNIGTDDGKNRVIGGPIQGNIEPEMKKESDSDLKFEFNETATSSHLPDSFFEDLFKEMADLKAEKENYQKTLDRFEEKKSEPKTKATRKASSKTTGKKTTTAKVSTAKAKTTSAKKNSAANKTTAAKKAPTTKSNESAKKPATTSARKTTKVAEKKPKKDEHDIIEEITSRKELKISDAHKKEQLNIINNFIEKEPVLTKRINTDNQSNKQEAEDLSASSTNLSDDVVSETLAKLMIKQGRKQKAIDIYKKLIWKFPQKKTYFVEIIDELKKES